MRVAVLGLGGVGTAAARFLAEAGHRVVGFEQFRLDHDRGSSYGASRIIRKVYPDAVYASLMEAAYPLWDELERQSGDELFLRCGGLFFGPRDHPDMSATERALSEVAVPYRALSASEAADRFPQFRLKLDEYGIWEPESGLLRASRCVLANARGATAAGAELREGASIEAIEPAGSGIRLQVNGAMEEFDRVVVTAGPWTGRLLEPWVRLPLTVTRQQYAHFAVTDRALYGPGRFPVWIDFGTLFYGFPEHDAIPGIKAALHAAGTPHDPDSPDREPSDADNQALREYLRRRIPGASGAVTFSKVCLYTMTPDEDFIVDRLPGEPRMVVVGGLSGHGFKFTVLLGRIAARLAAEQEPGCDLTRFSLTRFRA
jgi:sarcosine oxidase